MKLNYALLGHICGWIAAFDPDPFTKTLFGAGAAVLPQIPVLEGDAVQLYRDASPVFDAAKLAIQALDAKIGLGQPVSQSDVDAAHDAAQAVVDSDFGRAVAAGLQIYPDPPG